ncbi:response regulator transcription factor [Microbacterium sp. VKM Ac-2870]|uniref:response regulator transcription factor n=1 Tax=Microbacterium sp. VKM Ac-2870 TaxID=2783825 RepID=UPI00188C6DAC|nr:response regulator transcription factor [Microbacterium sp. VKM Ac-2870]MBF4561470.1 response regulator transcription factor [Microbacterium sp. VKM Ac-2870]
MSAPQPIVNVMVVEDQPLFREMLAVLLGEQNGLRVAAVAHSAEGARLVDARALDVALLDLRLPDGDGIGLGRELRRRHPTLGVLILSASDSISTLLEVPGGEAAGWGFLSKNSSLSASALVYAIRAVAAGRAVLDPAIRAQREIRRNSPLARLSARQREVVALVAEGLTNAAIAARLGISPRSVDAHLNAAYGVLGIPATRERNPRVEAVRSYLEHTTSPWTAGG